MLGSMFSSTTTSSNSSSHDQDLEDEPFTSCHHIIPHHHHHHHPPPPPPPLGGDVAGFTKFTPPPINTHQLLIRCAELVSSSEFPAAHHFLSFLTSSTSPLADSSMERLVHYFSNALALRLNHNNTTAAAATSNKNINAATTNTEDEEEQEEEEEEEEEGFSETLIQSSYLALNQITPFIRFSHLTANQAILEAVQGHAAVHIIDFDIMYGVQWPPFMQAIAAAASARPPSLRITGTGDDLALLTRTGDRLVKFAQSLNLNFSFHPLLLPTATSTLLLPTFAANSNEEDDGEEEEALAVNCVFYLNKLLHQHDSAVHIFLQNIKAMKPKVVTVAEREADHNHPHFLRRFVEALDHYAAIFESLEATVPPSSAERLEVERVWLGREIMDIVGPPAVVVGMGSRRRRRRRRRWEQQRRRYQRYAAWEVMLRSTGFCNVALSGFALSQAKLLLRLHYPSEGYQLQFLNDSSFLLGWHHQALFSVSSWR